MPDSRPKRLRPSGGYRTTASFRAGTFVYDATSCFCEKFLDGRSRTVDQMVQAACSGRQNIAEGGRAAASSSQSELRPLNVARASLEELLLDYGDFLRHRHLPLWTAGSPQARAVRNMERERRQKATGGVAADDIPRCPECDRPMALRTAKAGKNAGSQFWGCAGYPECKGIATL